MTPDYPELFQLIAIIDRTMSRSQGLKSLKSEGSPLLALVCKAVNLANQAIDLAGPLDSARYHQYLTDFQANITRAYGREHLVDEFTNTLRQRYPSLSLVGDV